MAEKLKKHYDLEERTAQFGEGIINLCRNITQDVISRPIISQLVRSGTSIGANYMEANSASSRRDFTYKIYICKKETQETLHWLRMFAKIDSRNTHILDQLRQECQELIFIFGKILSKFKIRN